MLTFGLLASMCPNTFFWPAVSVERMIPRPLSSAGMAILILIVVVFYTPPQLLLALLAGRLSSKCRIVIERR